MKYEYLGLLDIFPIIISSTLTIDQEERLINILRLNSKMLGVVKAKILKWLDVRIIYVISSIPWEMHTISSYGEHLQKGHNATTIDLGGRKF
ncbi:unnamed protein product [Spirodela intermedia]|uniref:Uncharacterized protein n=1 Tax=Spirodela intermedia TaxID=51605 RepID=A0A7I8KSV2_SPIIN|nr:unnamed protein product [Spirodela intermedia]